MLHPSHQVHGQLRLNPELHGDGVLIQHMQHSQQRQQQQQQNNTKQNKTKQNKNKNKQIVVIDIH